VPSIIVDAGPLIALFDRDDRYHRRAVAFIRNCGAGLITNLPALTEAAFLLRFSSAAQRDLLWWAHKSLDIDQGTAADLPRIIALLEKYGDLPADFADASLVALAERLEVSQVASVDRDFAIYRLSGKRRFENVFLNRTR
jgi:predicted nucleic acid-binding protein